MTFSVDASTFTGSSRREFAAFPGKVTCAELKGIKRAQRIPASGALCMIGGKEDSDMIVKVGNA